MYVFFGQYVQGGKGKKKIGGKGDGEYFVNEKKRKVKENVKGGGGGLCK